MQTSETKLTFPFLNWSGKNFLIALQQINIRVDFNSEQFNSQGSIWSPVHIIPLNKCLCKEETMEDYKSKSHEEKERGKKKILILLK